MSDAALEKATSQNAAVETTQEVLDKIVLLLVSGATRSVVEEAICKLGLVGELAASAIAEARMRIQIAARWDRNDQLGTALVRLNDIYRRALAAQDAKTALAVQKELNRLLDLYRPSAAPPEKTGGERSLPDSSATAEIAAARAYLVPLKLGDERTPLSELCRLAVLRIIDDGDGKGSISTPSRTHGRCSKGSGQARSRHRPNPTDSKSAST